MLNLTFVPIIDTQVSVIGHKQGFELAVPVLTSTTSVELPCIMLSWYSRMQIFCSLDNMFNGYGQTDKLFTGITV